MYSVSFKQTGTYYSNNIAAINEWVMRGGPRAARGKEKSVQYCMFDRDFISDLFIKAVHPFLIVYSFLDKSRMFPFCSLSVLSFSDNHLLYTSGKREQ